MTRVARRRPPAGRHEHQDRRGRRRSASRATPTCPSPATASDRINAALYYGGPQLLGETVGDLIGIEPDYVFVTRFEKFENMVNDIGGIDVDNPRRSSATPTSSRKGFEAGQASTSTATSRWRSPGSARPCSRGDFDRSANQQRVLRGIQAKIREPGRRARLHRVGRAVRDGEHGTPTPRRPSCSGWPRPWPQVEPVEDHQLRGAGRHRQRRRRQRRHCRTSTRPAATATRPATTPRSSGAEPQCPASEVFARFARPWHAPRCVGVAGRAPSMPALRRLAMHTP